MADCGKFADKKFLVIDRSNTRRNDRTWCFWEKQDGYFQNLVHHSWKRLDFKSPGLELELDIDEYSYKMIRGIDFYRYCDNKIKSLNIDYLYGEIELQGPNILLDSKPVKTGNAIVFNSIYIPAASSAKQTRLLQHFKGWLIESEDVLFDERRATLMDFNVSQQHGTTFVYVLPLSPYKALVEYTLFTRELIAMDEYDAGLKKYLRENMGLGVFHVLEKEYGVIPMTSEKFTFYKNGRYKYRHGRRPNKSIHRIYIQVHSEAIRSDHA